MSVAPSSDVLMQRVSVAFEYPVAFTRNAFDIDNRTLVEAMTWRGEPRRHRFVAVIDAGVAQAWPGLAASIGAYAEAHTEQLDLAHEPVTVVGGEAAKNDDAIVARIHELLFELRMDRQSVVLIIGGGAVQDVIGYAAATTHRGVRVVRMPTTVLSQNDAGVGVKNGINAFGTKNFLGTFAPPFAVVDDFAFLPTLSARDRVAGLAEAVKVALIRDAAFFDALEADADALVGFDEPTVARAIRRCAELHLQHIATSGDAFELGSARPLDYGHWSAHKLETMTKYALRHGEAVAIGMALDARYALESGRLDEGSVARICDLLERLGLPLWHPALGQRDDDGAFTVAAGLDEFREHLGGELTITLLDAIGRGVDVHDIDVGLVARSIDWLAARAAR